MSNTGVAGQTVQLKTDITNTVDSLKKNSGKLVGLLIAAAKHYWANSESPDVLNHLIKELSSFPSLQKKVISYACTFGKFEILSASGKPDQLINRQIRNEKGELIKEGGKPKRVTVTATEKEEYKAAIAAFEALQLPRLDMKQESSEQKADTQKVKRFSEKTAIKKVETSLHNFITGKLAKDSSMTPEKLAIDLKAMIDKALLDIKPAIEGEKA